LWCARSKGIIFVLLSQPVLRRLVHCGIAGCAGSGETEKQSAVAAHIHEEHHRRSLRTSRTASTGERARARWEPLFSRSTHQRCATVASRQTACLPACLPACTPVSGLALLLPLMGARPHPRLATDPSRCGGGLRTRVSGVGALAAACMPARIPACVPAFSFFLHRSSPELAVVRLSL
jgi:hypothetical protein